MKQINLSDIMTNEHVADLRASLSKLSQFELDDIMPRIEHYILVAIHARFPDIHKNTLHRVRSRIRQREFAFYYLR